MDRVQYPISYDNLNDSVNNYKLVPRSPWSAEYQINENNNMLRLIEFMSPEQNIILLINFSNGSQKQN